MYQDNNVFRAISLDENKSRTSPIRVWSSGSIRSSLGISLPLTLETRLRITSARFAFPFNNNQRGDSLVMLNVLDSTLNFSPQ